MPGFAAEGEAGLLPPNVFIILLDTLRADDTEPYGAPSGRTPALAEFAASGTTFLNISAPSSFTRTAIASAMTSLTPVGHRVHNKESHLPQDLVYLPEVMRRLGYRTLGVIQNPHLSREFGFERGFDAYHELFREAGGRNELAAARKKSPQAFAEYLWDEYLADAMTSPEKPFFTYLHLIDPHAPYDPPAPYDSKFYKGKPPGINASPQTLDAMISGTIPASEENLEYLRGRYRGEIAYMDDALRSLLERLKHTGAEENTVVIFLSDHGEEFWEHQGMHHWRTLYEEVLHVPFIVRAPGRVPPGRSVGAPGTLMDLPPTLLGILGLKPEESWQGDDLFAIAEQPAQAESRTLTGAVYPYRDADFRVMVRQGTRKLIASSVDGELQYELFDLAQDPEEKVNLWDAEAMQEDSLFKALERAMATREAGGDAIVHAPAEKHEDDEITTTLESLGYL